MIKIYEVGGCVRDRLLGRRPKDIDFVALAPSFGALRAHLEAEGFRLYQVKPEFLTIRAGVPTGHPLRAVCADADFVLARSDGDYSDGRRPDSVSAGSLADDLARRDFTINAMARDPLTGEIIDPHGGRADLARGVVRCVGSALDRLSEDGLRLIRAARFAVTLGFDVCPDIMAAASEPAVLAALDGVSTDRLRGELRKAFAHDTWATVGWLRALGIGRRVFARDGLWLEPTTRRP